MRGISMAYGLTLFSALLFIQGCAMFDSSEPEEDNMTVTVDFRDVHRCSRISPEIVVVNPPRGTNSYIVRLVEYGDVERILGGGTWREDGSGQIPEGALTNHYVGPCPKEEELTEYAYIVSAMQDGDPQPMEVRIYRFAPNE